MSSTANFEYKEGDVWPDNPLTLGDWEQKWRVHKIGFHKDHVHPYLEKYAPVLTGGSNSAKLFFPLCGKDIGMKWLYDQGHRIVGIEASTMGIEEFFQESNIEYSKEDAPAVNGKLYKSGDDRIHIYCCDLFAFDSSVEGHFDGIWDRGSLVAINKADRPKYAELVLSLFGDKYNYLLVTIKYDPQEYAGPPHYVPEEQIPQLFGSRCQIKLLEKEEVSEERWIKQGLSEFKQRIHHLTPL